MESIAAVVLTYNRRNLLRECLESLVSQEKVGFDILLIDNASTDGTFDYIKDLIDSGKVIYENTGSNLGGAAGFNFGIKKAVKLGYDRIWIMDDDCIPSSDALYELKKADDFLNGNFGWLYSVAYWTDGNLCKMNVPRAGLRKRVKNYSKPIVPAVSSTFVSLYVRSDAVKEVGLNYKDFFMYVDDMEFTLRISKKYPSYVVPSSKVIHKMPSNKCGHIEDEPEDRIWRYQYLYRNEAFVCWNQGLKGKLFIITKVGYLIIRVLLKPNKWTWKNIKTIVVGNLAGLKFKPKLEYID